MNKNFDIAYLRKYVNGELSDSEMYAIEKASHEDELLMDVLMGLEEEKKLNNPLEVADLHSAIFERTHPTKVRPIGFYKNLSIAASVLLALGIGTIWYLNRDQNKVAETMETVALDNKSDVPTDTTLNSIHLDSLDGLSEEDNLIALATPAEPAPTGAEASAETKKNANTAKPTVEEVLADNSDVFLREVPRSDTSTFHDKNDNRIASNEMGSFKKIDKTNVILMNGKTPAKSKQTSQAAVASADRVSSLQDVKKLATGRVLDQQSGRPIVSASVRDVKTNDVVMTDSSGQYILPLTSDNQKLEILSLGYEKELITASNNKIVQLKPSFGALDEVVVVGYGNKTEKVKSEPLVGWVAYKKYINDNSYQTLLGKGSVTLIFDISTFGRPIDISIKKSSNPDLSQKAIQIIHNGPDWKKGNDGKKIEVKINFR
ncbi:carboxypeptidase-like regulatory domain-containing protein [Sphingobacterium sp.]|uniref:carboxypeptidase-like regulatory domain-containing protein n=1 Tax=Sphingobacterium sp. TaxID=341027 RepID=UPI0028A5C403|nr:carboxypeptidase-like regulatory domain-containing protein [Sphingobacterium sp.]